MLCFDDYILFSSAIPTRCIQRTWTQRSDWWWSLYVERVAVGRDSDSTYMVRKSLNYLHFLLMLKYSPVISFSLTRPVASAIAERLWYYGSPNTDEFAPRLEELRCRLLRWVVAIFKNCVQSLSPSTSNLFYSVSVSLILSVAWSQIELSRELV